MGLPVLRRVPAQLHLGAVRAALQPRLHHLQRGGLVQDGLLQHVDVALQVVHLPLHLQALNNKGLFHHYIRFVTSTVMWR